MTLPAPYYEREGIRIYVGDNREVLPHIEPVHAVVTDPPSGISFMGKEWDSHKGGRDQWIAWLASVLSECNRVMLPGAHALIWALPRTSGWTSMAIEDAGLDVRDCITHLFGSGFPKSHDVSKAIDKLAGAEREKVPATGWLHNNRNLNDDGWSKIGSNSPTMDSNHPATPAAEQWQGWGTALKPAAEFWYLARKPFKGTVAANVLAFGTGAINVDACRIGTEGGTRGVDFTKRYTNGIYNDGMVGDCGIEPIGKGRWPANVILDEAAAEALDAQSGERKSGTAVRHRSGGNTFGGDNAKPPLPDMGYGDTGGASRFFYCAKSSRRERNAGLDGMPEQDSRPLGLSNWKGQTNGSGKEMGPSAPQSNSHPTVKPLALMRYLIQMVTPPGGIVLDPFMGSGSTLVAAAELGFNAIGIELSEEYAEIAARRVDHALNERAKRLPGLEATS